MPKCVACGGAADAAMEHQELPNFGETIIFSVSCSNCGYRQSDIWSIDEKAPVRITLKASKADLSARVVKSSAATLRLPELGIEVRPGPASEGYISNVEGVLYRLAESLKGMLASMPEKKANIEKLVKKLDRLMDGEPFTMIIEDPSGNSLIDSKNAKISKLKKARAK